MSNTIKDFFLKNTKFNDNDVLSIEHITNSFTNDVYHIVLKDNSEFKLRMANFNEYIDRKLEKHIETSLFNDDILFYDEQGNFIKKWYIGKTLEKKDLSNEIFSSILEFIDKFQKINLQGVSVKKPVYVLHDHLVEKKLIKPLLAYKKIINEDVKTNNDVLCHNDLSCNNSIIFKNNITVMDFEWATLNHPYWDISNLIKDLELTFDELLSFDFVKNMDLNLLIKIIYATHFYTYYWTLKVEETQKIINYRNEVIKQIFYWYNILKERKILHA